MRPARILFVCTGNTCRSPMAEAVARCEAERRGLAGVEFRSAGVHAVPGMPASPAAVRAGGRHGLDLSGHRSADLASAGVGEGDLVLVMTRGHARVVRERHPEAAVRLVTAALGEGDPRRGADVPDPFGGADEEYEAAWGVLHDCVAAVLADLAAGGDE
ncbi:MAG: low molecular weight protein arginine phosphatase [Gemmatimonadota bacterium]|nr:low molecular weight protein arginine phosphatase [Gemmatimonadota bacterium]